MKRLKQTILSLLLLLPIVSTGAKSDLVRGRRETTEWTVSGWSRCSSTCGGGIRTRSVRCLDEDGVIASDCDNNNRPQPYEFCNRIDCTSSVPLPNVFPPSGDYLLENEGNSSTVVRFDALTQESYEIEVNTTESDGTVSFLRQTVTPTSIQSTSGISGRRYQLGIRSANGVSSFTVDGQNLITLNAIQTRNIPEGANISYSSNSVTVNSGAEAETFPNVRTFYYYDGYRFYQFPANKINRLLGQGKLYVHAASGVALFSNRVGLNIQLDNAIAVLNQEETSTTATTATTATTSTTATTATTSTTATTATAAKLASFGTFTVTITIPQKPTEVASTEVPSTEAPSTEVPSTEVAPTKVAPTEVVPDQEVLPRCDNSPSAPLNSTEKGKSGRHNQANPGSNSFTPRRRSKRPHSSPIPRPLPSKEKSRAHQRRRRPNASPRSDTTSAKDHRQPSRSQRRRKPSPGPESSPSPNSQQHNRPTPLSDSSVKRHNRPRQPRPEASRASPHDASRQEHSQRSRSGRRRARG